MVFGAGADIYRSLGVKSAITASGSTTLYGGSKLRPEVLDAMEKASATMVNMDDLNVAAGKVIAEVTGAEAGLVEKRGAWARIALPGGSLQGWVPAATVEEVEVARAPVP